MDCMSFQAEEYIIEIKPFSFRQGNQQMIVLK